MGDEKKETSKGENSNIMKLWGVLLFVGLVGWIAAEAFEKDAAEWFPMAVGVVAIVTTLILGGQYFIKNKWPYAVGVGITVFIFFLALKQGDWGDDVAAQITDGVKSTSKEVKSFFK